MSIRIDNHSGLITLHTAHTTYQMWVDDQHVLHHLYYGAYLGNADLRSMEYWVECGFSPTPGEMHLQREYSLDTICQEYTGCGVGDYRISSLSVQNPDGSFAADLRFIKAEAQPGKYACPGLPAAQDEKNDCETLRITLKDAATGLTVVLLYGVYEQQDFITRAALLENGGNGTMRLEKVASACLDLPFGQWELIHFHGRYNMERQTERIALPYGIQSFGSRRGASSHHHNPFAILAAPTTTEDAGDCIGAMLVYSGNFQFELEVSQQHSTRLVAGLTDENFCWMLAPGEIFVTPEVLFHYNDNGLGALSHSYHRFLTDNILRGPWKHRCRPVLINNWEATYLNFDGDKIVSIARKAHELGVELMVLDDGWFGNRYDDTSGLGDWQVNETKLGCTLSELIERIRGFGMDFGLWVEPEMVSPGTALYAAHPDWALTIPGRAPTMGRSQLVLDLGRPEVVEYLYNTFSTLLRENPISYIKWDMNRHMTDVFSHSLPADRQGEVAHRYMLGLYDLLERLTSEFPEVLWEGCSGGGGRFDAGMLYYFPQIWCSDDTDAIQRLKIQYGTSFGYPTSAVGSHVSAVPNHQTGRSTPLNTRAVVAMAGTFGYELDLQLLSDEEKSAIHTQIETCKQVQALVQEGRYDRLTNAMTDTFYTAWQLTSEDSSRALISVVVLDNKPNPWPIHLWCKGLVPDAHYRNSLNHQTATGAVLCRAGITLPVQWGDYPATQIWLERIE